MPTRISAGLGDTLVSLLFNTIIPIDCKLIIFPYLKVCTKKTNVYGRIGLGPISFVCMYIIN